MRFVTKVVRGHGRGKGMGFPTLNLVIPEELDFDLGVYGGRIKIAAEKIILKSKEAVVGRDDDGVWLRGGFHFGEVPVFNQKEVTLEVFVLDVEIIGMPGEVEFELVQKLREVEDFVSVEALVKQIGMDVERVRKVVR